MKLTLCYIKQTSNGVKICGLQKNTLIDYPGRVAATVFLCGCNFCCPWCYSREIVLPEEIEKQTEIPQKDFFDFLKERKDLLEGVVVCGGEPTIHHQLSDFIQKIKELSFLVKLDTNGSNPEMLKQLINDKLIDYAAMDIKAPKEKYEKAVGVKVDIKKIQESIDILKEDKIDYEFRTTVVPQVHSKEDMIQIAEWLSGSTRLRQGFGGRGKYYLQNFRPEKNINPEFAELKPYSEEELSEIQKAIAPLFEVCQIR